MTGWQAQILWDLYRAHARCASPAGSASGPRATRVAAAGDRGACAARCRARTLAAHLAMLSDRYLATTSPQRIAGPPAAASTGCEEEVLATELFHHPDLGSSELVVATRDVPGLFSLIAGTLAAHGINILSAQIHTRADGIVIDTFQVNDPFGEAVTEEARWRRTLEALRRVLRGEASVEDAARPAAGGARRAGGRGGAAQDLRRQPALRQPHRAGGQVPGPGRAALRDHPHALRPRASTSASARIATEIDQAYDTFYVTDRQGRRARGRRRR